MHTINPVEIGFDPAKDARNVARGRLSFEAVAGFDFDSAIVKVDDRKEYGETRYIAYGFVGARLHALVFTLRDECLHVISFRKANKREVRNHEKARQ